VELPQLETERLRVRPFTLADRAACERLMQSLGDAGVRHEWLTWVVLNVDELEQLHQPPYGDRALTLRANGEVVGIGGLVPSFGPFGTLPGFDVDPESAAARRNTPEFGLYWALAPEHRGKGYATEAARALIDYAFNTLNLRRIIATTEYTNEASMAVMRRLGMRIERNPNPEPFWFQIVGVLENTR